MSTETIGSGDPTDIKIFSWIRAQLDWRNTIRKMEVSHIEALTAQKAAYETVIADITRNFTDKITETKERHRTLERAHNLFLDHTTQAHDKRRDDLSALKAEVSEILTGVLEAMQSADVGEAARLSLSARVWMAQSRLGLTVADIVGDKH